MLVSFGSPVRSFSGVTVGDVGRVGVFAEGVTVNTRIRRQDVYSHSQRMGLTNTEAERPKPTTLATLSHLMLECLWELCTFSVERFRTGDQYLKHKLSGFARERRREAFVLFPNKPLGIIISRFQVGWRHALGTRDYYVDTRDSITLDFCFCYAMGLYPTRHPCHRCLDQRTDGWTLAIFDSFRVRLLLICYLQAI